jgi:streptomycin 6-kinase
VEIPPELTPLRTSPEGNAWLEHLPDLVERCVSNWSLRLGPPFAGASASIVFPATLPDGHPAVLKVQFPHRESDHEAAALRVWDGYGAVRLLASDDERSALLLERCLPGTPLTEEPPDRALDIAIELLPRLWRPAAEPFRTLADEAAWWIGYLTNSWDHAGRPFERDLLEAALEALHELPASQGEQVLVHQDLHAGNVLRAHREPWLVIDPKPLLGEREFGLVALIRGKELGDGRAAVLGRLDRLSEKLGLDRDRARRWTLAQTIAWSFHEHEIHLDSIETARWLMEAE